MTISKGLAAVSFVLAILLGVGVLPFSVLMLAVILGLLAAAILV